MGQKFLHIITLLVLLIVFSFFALLIGDTLPFEFAGHVFLGWLWYAQWALSRVEPDVAMIVQGMVTAALSLVGLHLICRWFYAQREQRQFTSWPLGATACLWGVFVLTFVLGICGIGIIHQLVWFIQDVAASRT